MPHISCYSCTPTPARTPGSHRYSLLLLEGDLGGRRSRTDDAHNKKQQREKKLVQYVVAGGSDNYARPLICNINNNMASWFSGGALGETFNGLKDKVQSKVNNIDPDLIKKLTLQSDELVSERQRIDEEERRKENVRDSLAEIFPWETRDAEMEILVDECKEVSFSHL